jgi:hypothetical protein
MGSVQYLKVSGYIKQIFVPTHDPSLLSIFEEEKVKIGLSETDIDLQVPEEPDYHEDTLWRLKPAETLGNSDWGYSIVLFPISAERSDYTLRQIIRHELTHIKNGDCDRELPGFFGWLYNNLVEEPRAKWYAMRG